MRETAMFLPPSSCSSSWLKLLQNSGHVGETGRDTVGPGRWARNRFIAKDIGGDKGNYNKRTRSHAEGPEKTQVLCPRRTVVALAVCLWQLSLSVSALVFFFFFYFVFLPVTESSTLTTECLSSNASSCRLASAWNRATPACRCQSVSHGSLCASQRSYPANRTAIFALLVSE